MSKKDFDRSYSLLRNTHHLLQDENLVWSLDFNYVKDDLAKLMKEQAPLGNLANPHILAIADKLMFDEYDISESY